MMDKSQIGRAGELAIELYTLVTAGGEVDIYSPVVDDVSWPESEGVLRLSASRSRHRRVSTTQGS